MAVRFVVQFCFWQFGILAPTHHPDLFCLRDLQAEHESSLVFSIAWQVSYTGQVTDTGPSTLQSEFEMQWRIKEVRHLCTGVFVRQRSLLRPMFAAHFFFRRPYRRIGFLGLFCSLMSLLLMLVANAFSTSDWYLLVYVCIHVYVYKKQNKTKKRKNYTPLGFVFARRQFKNNSISRDLADRLALVIVPTASKTGRQALARKAKEKDVAQ